MGTEKIALGKKGEEIAAEYLKKKGYKIIERNYRSNTGEIDIIALHKGTTVFVEVKTRKGNEFGLPQEAVDRHKQWKIEKVALNYIRHRHLPEASFRFDVVSVDFSGDKPAVSIIPDAFQLEGL